MECMYNFRSHVHACMLKAHLRLLLTKKRPTGARSPSEAGDTDMEVMLAFPAGLLLGLRASSTSRLNYNEDASLNIQRDHVTP